MTCDERVHQSRRMVIGHCPQCFAALVILNDGEVWAVVYCQCGWLGGTTELLNHIRYEMGAVIMRETNVRWCGRGHALYQGIEYDPLGEETKR